MRRIVLAISTALALCAAVAGCGGAGAKEKGEVTITVTSRGYAEEEVLREIYARALEAAGFKVKRKDGPGLPPEELEKGLISGYPEHLNAGLVEVASVPLDDVPGQARAAFRMTKQRLEEKGLVPLRPTSFGRTNVVGIRRETAEASEIVNLADLEQPSRSMSVAGGEYYCYCFGRNCLASLEVRYGVVFGGFSVTQSPGRLTKDLKGSEIDAAMFFTTDGRLAHRKEWLVLLEDEEGRLPASNAFWLTSQDVIDEAGPDYEKAIFKAQEGLTLEVMRELDAKVELEGQSPGKVAAEYLQTIDFRG
jgi:osmoprotectant transport system substrate-binding protein